VNLIQKRRQIVEPDFFLDDELADLPFEHRLFFAGLWCHADRRGRLEDKPKTLKVKIMPYDNIDVEKIVSELSKKFIVRYEVLGRKYIQINNFEKHQVFHKSERESKIPGFTGEIPVKQPVDNGETREGIGIGTGIGTGIGIGKKKVRKKMKKANPSLKEIIDYIKKEKLSVNPINFYKHFTAGDDKSLHWIDSEGKTVFNWKQKIRTWEGFKNDNRQGIGKSAQAERRKEETFQKSDSKNYGSGVERGFAGKPSKDL
jgi:hypothetical protein